MAATPIIPAMIIADMEAVTPSMLSSILIEFIKPITQTSVKNILMNSRLEILILTLKAIRMIPQLS